jgi:hypothetical protein
MLRYVLMAFALATSFLALVHATPEKREVLIKGVPHVKQKPDYCGEACGEMVLRKLGYDADQDYVFKISGLDPKLGRGCYTRDLKKALEAIGFQVGKVWHQVKAGDAGDQMEDQFRDMLEDLQKGVPSIVCTHYNDQPDTTEHFRLVLGYDGKTEEVIYHEPAESDGAYRRMDRELFLKLWPLKYNEEVWTVIRFRMVPERIVAKKAGVFEEKDFEQHVKELAGKIPSDDFHVVVQPPFVVIGDEPEKWVEQRAKNTVGWAVRLLKKAYFKKDPGQIIDIWLFKDDQSYQKHAKELFGDEPDTPFGYYSETHRALVMNIATGGGTLVHEIVHPFVKSNFPDCPAWFNEGLGSLYEQCGERDGEIVGFTNWRLAGLQRAIKSGVLPSFQELTATTEREFYTEDPGSNYGQSRYLCYYLQQQGLLRKFYREFYDKRKDDPTGYQTLKKVLDVEDMEEFQENWEKWVLKLTFP